MTKPTLTREQILIIEDMVYRRMENTGEDHATASAHIRYYLSQHQPNKSNDQKNEQQV